MNCSILINIQNTKLLSDIDSRHGCNLTMFFMKLHQSININIRYTITIGQHKRFIANIFPDPLYSSAGHGIQSGIYQSYFPRLCIGLMHSHGSILRKIKRNITGMQIIICEPLFYHMLFISTADDKIIISKRRIIFHDMP